MEGSSPEDNSSLDVSQLPWQQFRAVIEQHYGANAKWVTNINLFFLTLAYATLIIIGACGNLGVLAAILRNPEMRTARNVFIGNLAVSDLCLCCVTMPLTLVEVVYQRWQWGDSHLLCHLHSPIQGVFIIISSLSISAIAIDRCIVICVSAINNFSTVTCLSLLPGIWVAGLLISSPAGIYSQLLSTGESLALTSFPFSGMVSMYTTYGAANLTALYRMDDLLNKTYRSNTTGLYTLVEGGEGQAMVVDQVDFLIKEMGFPSAHIVSHAECNEVWPSTSLELCYTLLVTLVQFLLPLIVATVANAAIYSTLKVVLPLH